MEGVSIIIPTRNEAENIDPLLERIHLCLKSHEYAFEVVFSDGASADKTTEIIRQWQDKAAVQLVENEEGKGLAAAVIAGARAAVYDLVVVMDADLSHPPETIPDLLEPLRAGRADMVVGSRYVRGGTTPDWPLKRKVISTLATLPARMFTHIKDPLAGFIAVRKQRLASIEDEVCGFKIGLELLATAEDELRVQEVPITFRDRRWGESKLSGGVVRDYLRQLAMLVGVNLLPGGFNWLLPVFLTVTVIDSVLLTAFLHYGIVPGWAHWFSFLPASALGSLLAVKTVSRNDIRAAGRLLNWYLAGTVCICILTLFLRSGLVATMVRMQGELTTAGVFYLAFLGFLFAYLGIIFWVHSRKQRRIDGRQVRTFYGLGVVFYLIVLRLVYLGGLDLLPEEHYYYQLLVQAHNSEISGVVPAPALIGAMGLSGSNQSLLGFRFGTWLIWLVALTFIFSLARDMYDRQVAFSLVLVFSIVPFFFAAGLFVIDEAILSLIWCAALYYLYRAMVAEARMAWIWAGLVLGAGMQLDVRLIALFAGSLVYLLSSTESQKVLNRLEPYMGLAAISLTFLPTIMIRGGHLAVDALNRDVYTGPPWVESVLGEGVGNAFLLPFIMLTPTVLAAGLIWGWLVFRLGQKELRYEGERAERHSMFILSVSVVPLLIFLVPGLFPNSILCATGLAWGGVLPAIAALLAFRVEPARLGPAGYEPIRAGERGKDNSNSGYAGAEKMVSILQRCWWPTVGIMLAVYGVTLQLQVV